MYPRGLLDPLGAVAVTAVSPGWRLQRDREPVLNQPQDAGAEPCPSLFLADGSKGIKSIRQKLESFSKERKGEQPPFYPALVPALRGLVIFGGVGGARIQQDASSQVVLLFLGWHELHQAWKARTGVWNTNLHFQAVHLEMCLSAHFAPISLLPVLFYRPLKDLGDNPRAHRTLEQSQVGMSFPTSARSPLKGTTDSDASYFTKRICGSAPGVKPQGSAGAGGEESPPCQGDGQGQLFGKNATNMEIFLSRCS